jgi:hypothetical protein
VSAIKATRAVAVAAVLDVADFDSLSDEARGRVQDPFFYCFQEVVRGVAVEGVFETPDVKVDMVFSSQDEFQGCARSLYEAMLSSIDVRNRMGGLEFYDMRVRPALQAADLIAYELRQHDQRGREEPPRPTRWPFREIVEHQRHTLGALRLKYLRCWYLEAQADGRKRDVLDYVEHSGIRP